MKKYKTVKQIVERNILQSVVCNMCGQAQQTDEAGNPNSEFVHIRKSWGYWSNKDMTVQHVDLCETCWDKICKKLKIAPVEDDMFINGPFDEVC